MLDSSLLEEDEVCRRSTKEGNDESFIENRSAHDIAAELKLNQFFGRIFVLISTLKVARDLIFECLLLFSPQNCNSNEIISPKDAQSVVGDWINMFSQNAPSMKLTTNVFLV